MSAPRETARQIAGQIRDNCGIDFGYDHEALVDLVDNALTAQVASLTADLAQARQELATLGTENLALIGEIADLQTLYKAELAAAEQARDEARAEAEDARREELAALAKAEAAEAEGPRQGVKDAYEAISADMATALQHLWIDESRKDAALGALNAIYVRVRQLLPQTTTAVVK